MAPFFTKKDESLLCIIRRAVDKLDKGTWTDTLAVYNHFTGSPRTIDGLRDKYKRMEEAKIKKRTRSPVWNDKKQEIYRLLQEKKRRQRRSCANGSAPCPSTEGGTITSRASTRTISILSPEPAERSNRAVDTPPTTVQRRLDADNEVRPKSDGIYGPLSATPAQDTLIEHLTDYLFPENGSDANAPALFDCLQTVWSENEKDYSSIMKTDFNSNQQALRAWIDERKASREIRRMTGGQSGSPAAERAKRLRAIGRLRTLRRQAPAGRVCKIFSLMTKTKEEGLFREGLDRLAEDDADILDPDDFIISMG